MAAALYVVPKPTHASPAELIASLCRLIESTASDKRKHVEELIALQVRSWSASEIAALFEEFFRLKKGQ